MDETEHRDGKREKGDPIIFSGKIAPEASVKEAKY